MERAALAAEVASLDSEVQYTGRMYLGMMLSDTKDIDAEREWELLHKSLKDRVGTHGVLHKLYMNFGGRVRNLLASEYGSPALNDRPLTERRDVLDRRRRVVADLLPTLACVRRLLDLHDGTDKEQKDTEEIGVQDMRDSEAMVVKVLDGWQHGAAGWSHDRVRDAITGPAAKAGRVEKRLIRGRTTTQMHALACVIAERRNLAIDYVKTGGRETLTTTALEVELAAVHPAYRDALLPHLVEDLLESYGECPGNQRLVDRIDESHKT